MDDDDNDSALSIYGSIHSDDEDDDESGDISVYSNINFDRSLPTSHAYLGEDLEETSGRTILDEESCLEMAIISLPGLVLMPGQTLPLHLFAPTDIAIIKYVLDTHKTFGQLAQFPREDENEFNLFSIGTTVEVLATKNDGDSMKVKAIGRQKFKLLEFRRDIGGVLMGKIKILPEIILKDQLLNICSPYTLKFFNNSSKKKFLKLTSSYLHPPYWIFHQYHQKDLMKQIMDELHGWNDAVEMQEDATSLNDPIAIQWTNQNAIDYSYRVASILPIDDVMKLKLLQLTSPVQRLRCELNIIRKCSFLCCRKCGSEVGQKEDMLRMSREGAMGAYVNPGGHVHETLTIRKANNINLLGSPSIQSSWFPGYAWTIGVCKRCKQHMGWRFQVAEENSPLTPQKFWGLCRASVAFKFSADETFIPVF